jgi:glycosyltransferase involved in cell wall biosynthesis
VEPRLFAGAEGHDALAGVPRPRVVFVGRLAHQKGVRHLVDAAALLRTPGASVTLVGDGPERRELERRVAERGVADRVRILGFVPHDEVPAVLAATDVLVLPSIYEELGSVLLEGLQAGRPIVASRTGGIPDALGDAGVLVAPGDPRALAAALDALLADPARRAKLSALARERAAAYDWDVLGERVLGVYRLATGAGAGRPAVRQPLAPRA